MHTKHPKELVDDDDTNNYAKLDGDDNDIKKEEPKLNKVQTDNTLDLGDGPKLKK